MVRGAGRVILASVMALGVGNFRIHTCRPDLDVTPVIKGGNQRTLDRTDDPDRKGTWD